jgi:hypothetical protein
VTTAPAVYVTLTTFGTDGLEDARFDVMHSTEEDAVAELKTWVDQKPRTWTNHGVFVRATGERYRYTENDVQYPWDREDPDVVAVAAYWSGFALYGWKRVVRMVPLARDVRT